jgi:hypothetical protein
MMSPGAASAVQKQKPTLEEEIFRLKLEWMMAKTDVDKGRISEEIRRRIGLSQTKD